jgi:hypothetical protein
VPSGLTPKTLHSAHTVYSCAWYSMTVIKTSDYYLNKINRPIFTVYIQSALCKVETECFAFNLDLIMLLAVSSASHCWVPRSMPVHVISQWPKRHWGGVFSDYFGFPLSVSFYQCSILIFIYMPFLPGHRAKPGTFQNNAQKDGSQRALNRDRRADEDSTHLPVWPNPSNSLF